MSVECFWVDVDAEVELSLRRYSYRDERPPACPFGFHDASVSLGRVAAEVSDGGHLAHIDPARYAGDVRWPTVCDWGCGYVFGVDDRWQVNQGRVFRAGSGESWDERRLPPGAMLDGTWLPQKGADGVALVVVLPPAADDTRGHWWHVDGPSRNGGVAGPGWTRTGDPKAEPATVSATPSILTDDYHGYLLLEDGRTVLTDHLG